MPRPRRKTAEYSTNAVQSEPKTPKVETKNKKVKLEIQPSPSFSPRSHGEPRTPLRALSVNTFRTPECLSSSFSTEEKGSRGRRSLSLPSTPKAIGEFLSANDFEQVAPGKAAFSKETCYRLFSEDMLEPAKFFSDLPAMRDLKMEHIKSMISTSMVTGLLHNNTGIAENDKNSPKYALAFYCLCLASVTCEEHIAVRCSNAVMAAVSQSSAPIGLLELRTVLINWGLISTNDQLPDHIAKFIVNKARATVNGTPKMYNVDALCKVAAKIVASSSPDEVGYIPEILSCLVELGLDIQIGPVLAYTKMAIRSCIDKLSTCVEYKAEDLINLLCTEIWNIEDTGNFVYACTVVLPAIKLCRDAVTRAMYKRLRAMDKKDAGHDLSEGRATVKMIVCLLASRNCQILKKLLCRNHYDLHQILVLLDCILTMSEEELDSETAESLVSITTRLAVYFSSSGDKKSCYFFEIIDRLKSTVFKKSGSLDVHPESR